MEEVWPALGALAAVIGLVWAAFRAGRREVTVEQAVRRADAERARGDALVESGRAALEGVTDAPVLRGGVLRALDRLRRRRAAARKGG